MSNNTKFKADGVVMYAKVHEPDNFDPDKPMYTVDLIVDGDTEEALKGLGLNPRRNKTGELVKYPEHEGVIFKLKSKYKPQLVDSKGNPVGPDVVVGNGSKVRVYGNAYEWSFKGSKGVAGALNALQVIDLVEFKKGIPVDKIEGGFEANSGVIDIDDGDYI